MQFNERISEAIKESPYNQKEIARLLNISESNITNWKKGQNLPSVDILYKLCILLDESADYLIGLEDETGKKINAPKYHIGTLNNNGKLEIK